MGQHWSHRGEEDCNFVNHEGAVLSCCLCLSIPDVLTKYHRLGADKQQKCASHRAGAWKSEIETLAGSLSGEGLHLVHGRHFPAVSSHGGGRGSSLGTLPEGHLSHSQGLYHCDLTSSQRPHFQRPSLQVLGFQRLNFGGDTFRP